MARGRGIYTKNLSTSVVTVLGTTVQKRKVEQPCLETEVTMVKKGDYAGASSQSRTRISIVHK